LLAAVPLALLNMCVNGIPRSWESLNSGPWTALALTGALGFLLSLALVWMADSDWQSPASALGWAVAFARAGDTNMLWPTLRIGACSWAATLAVVAAMVGGALVGCSPRKYVRCGF
jgi:hypothetical protein